MDIEPPYIPVILEEEWPTIPDRDLMDLMERMGRESRSRGLWFDADRPVDVDDSEERGR